MFAVPPANEPNVDGDVGKPPQPLPYLVGTAFKSVPGVFACSSKFGVE